MAEMKIKASRLSRKLRKPTGEVYKRRRAEAIRNREFHCEDDEEFGQIDILVNNVEVPGDSHLSRNYPMKLGKTQQHGYFTQPFGLRELP